MENGGQSELERFEADSKLKRGFVGSILGTFPVLRGKGYFWRDFGKHSHFGANLSGKAGFIPKWGIGKAAECITCAHSG